MAENNIQVFENSEFGSVRTIERNGEPWFCGRDVATALGYVDVKSALVDHIDAEDRQILQRRQIATLEDVPNRGMTFINESGLYSLVLSSKLPNAKQFKKWVTSDVIPAVRKHGAYMTPETIQEVLLNPDTIIQLALQLKEEASKRKALESTVATQTKRIAEMAPKVSYCDSILRCEEAVTTTIIAKDYGMSAVAFNRKLNELGIQYRMGKVWVPYQKYADQGYTKTETYHYEDDVGKDHANVLMKWTQKGRLFLYEELKSVGILPSIERAA